MLIPVIDWSIMKKVLSVTQINFCELCLSEKFYIIKSLNDPNLLNKKFELVNTCCQQSKLTTSCLILYFVKICLFLLNAGMLNYAESYYLIALSIIQYPHD